MLTFEYLLSNICLYSPSNSTAMPFRSSLPPYLTICAAPNKILSATPLLYFEPQSPVNVPSAKPSHPCGPARPPSLGP
jgi:hypothetical protein